MLKKVMAKIRKADTPQQVTPAPFLPEFPGYMCIETTNACNLRCIQCLYQGGTNANYKRPVTYIDVDLAKHVIDQLAEHGSNVMLNGDGETLLHPQFHEIASYACEKLNKADDPGFNVFFNTNGNLMTPEFADRFVEYFTGMLSFSLDGFKDDHERIRRGSDYDLVISNMEYLQKRITEKQAPISVQVNYCNYDQAEGTREKFVKHWVERVDAVSIGEVYDEDYKIASNRLNRPESKERLRCNVPWETFIVCCDGNIVPCSNCFCGKKSEIFGNASTDSLTDIWHGEKAKALRTRVLQGKTKGTVCELCERWNMYHVFGESEEDGMIVKRTGVFTLYSKAKPA